MGLSDYWEVAAALLPRMRERVLEAQLARELGVRVGQLRTWRLEFEKEAVTGIAKPDRSAAEDLEQLRRENAKLKMEIEILKKAAIYFARESK